MRLAARGSTLWFVLALLAFGSVYSSLYLGLASRWWFEDDPSLFAYTATIHNPGTIFTDPNLLRHFTGGAALVPLQLVSYWVDIKLAGFSPRFAYAHQAGSFLLTLLLLYLLLSQLLQGNKIAAFAGSALWALLPATAVVVQFLATRHYLEGLLFSFLSLYLAERFQDRPWAIPAVLLSALIAMLYKEIYAPVVPALLLVSAWRHRARALALGTTLMACVYAVYRTWVLGPGLRYGDMPLLKPWPYVKFLSKLPYTISSNYGGYCLLAIAVALCIHGVLRRRAQWTILCFAGLCIVSILAILPVSFPLYGMIRRPDPWYRIVFLLHTILVCFGTYFAARWTTRRVQGMLGIATLAILLPGVAKTRKLWVEMTSSAEREGKFYLAYPDRILLSEQEAWWFIPGVEWMSGSGKPHYVLSKDLATAKIPPGVPLWRFRDGAFVPEVSASDAAKPPPSAR
ncbi:MAG TPA: hypothetical protein VGG72_14170 [Bryobacteraceae bacterium]